MLIYTNQKSRRKKKSAKQLRLNSERAEYFKSLGIKKVKHVDRSYNLECSFLAIDLQPNTVSLSNAIVAGGFKRSVDDYKWKRDREESAETIKEIERKKTKIAPAFSKGAMQYITDDTDPTHLGRKL